MYGYATTVPVPVSFGWHPYVMLPGVDRRDLSVVLPAREELELDAEKWHADPEAVPLWQRRRLVFASFLSRRGGIRLSLRALSFLKLSERAERRDRWLGFGAAAVMAISLGGGAVAYVHAVRAQEETSRLKLIEEQSSREQAERQMHQVQAKQLKIDELLRDLADSPKKETVLALQRQIRDAATQGMAEPKEARPPVVASSGRAVMSVAPLSTTSAKTVTSTPLTSSSAPEIPVIKQQNAWE